MPQTHYHNIFLSLHTLVQQGAGFGLFFSQPGLVVADREAPNVIGVFKDDSKLNENYANWIYT